MAHIFREIVDKVGQSVNSLQPWSLRGREGLLGGSIKLSKKNALGASRIHYLITIAYQISGKRIVTPIVGLNNET